MQSKSTPTKDHNLGSPLDSWKSSDGAKKAGSEAYTAYQDQVSNFEAEGNNPRNQTIKSKFDMKNFNELADRGIKEAKNALKVSGEWVKENPVLAIGVGLCLGFLVGSQIKSRFGSKSSRIL